MTHEEYLQNDAVSLAEMVRSGAVTPTELLDLATARIAALNPRLNAVVYSMEEEARRHAPEAPGREPFPGVPFLAKDLVSNYAPHPTSAASRLLKDIPTHHDSEMARRVKAAGLLVLGKTNLPEWGLVPYTEPELFGPCNNPWNLARSTGGSSGGSAAAVAAGIVPMAGGGDGGGSIRIPASCCGLFGLKPTRGRTPTGPDYGLLWRGAVVEHVLTRSVRDSAVMLDATRGPDPGAPFEIPPPSVPYARAAAEDPPGLRIAMTTRPHLLAEVHPDCVAAAEDAARLLEDLGHDVTEAAPETGDPQRFAMAFLTMVAAELAADFRDVEEILGKKVRRGEVEPATWALSLLGRSIPSEAYASALRTLERVGRSLGPFFREYDFLLTPTLAFPPPPHGALAPSGFERMLLKIFGALGSGTLLRMAGLLEQVAGDAFGFIPWTPVYNVTGHPAASLPLYWNGEGLPVGIHLVGRWGREDLLFQLSGQLERARPWFDRLPELARAG
ncbi:MAG: amidase [Gemmatimonadota bacterium]